jgi:hypothetical protein
MKKEAKKLAQPHPPLTPFTPRRPNLQTERELAEIAFLHKASALGFDGAKPFGDSERYDFILDSGERLWRVQLKSLPMPSAAVTDTAPPVATVAVAIKTCSTPPTISTSSLPTSLRETFG